MHTDEPQDPTNNPEETNNNIPSQPPRPDESDREEVVVPDGFSRWQQNQRDMNKVEDTLQKVKNELHRVVIGQDEMMDLLMAALLTGGHVLIEGVPGIAKTLTANLLAQTISVDFNRIQFTPDLMPTDVVGTNVFNLKTSDFAFNKGPVFSNVVLIDEVNRAPAKTQAALFEVMEEKQVTIDGVTYPMDFPFSL